MIIATDRGDGPVYNALFNVIQLLSYHQVRTVVMASLCHRIRRNRRSLLSSSGCVAHHLFIEASCHRFAVQVNTHQDVPLRNSQVNCPRDLAGRNMEEGVTMGEGRDHP